MSDYVYDSKKAEFFRNYTTQAIWDGVYLPLAAPKTAKHSVLRTVLSRWRVFATKLGKAGFTPCTGDGLPFVRNCPIAGIVNYKRMRVCNRVKICPFCWGRRVIVKAHERFRAVLFLNDVQKYARPEYAMGGFYYERKFPTLEDAISCHKYQRNLELDIIQPLGSTVISYIVPIENGFEVRRRGMVIMAKGRKVPRFDHTESRTAKELYTKEKLAEVVGRAYHYPFELFKADPKRVVELLDATDKLRILSSTGLLYGKQAKVKLG